MQQQALQLQPKPRRRKKTAQKASANKGRTDRVKILGRRRVRSKLYHLLTTNNKNK
jgi:hypothetical protein